MKMPQWAARYTLPTTSVLNMFGGKWGKQVSTGLETSYVRQQVSAAQKHVALLGKLKALGLAGGKGTAAREAADKFINSGALGQGMKHADAKVDELARFIKGMLDDPAEFVENFKDMDGNVFEIAEPVLRTAREKVLKATRAEKLMGNKHKTVRDMAWEAWQMGAKNEADLVKLGFDAKEAAAGAKLLKIFNNQLTGKVIEEGTNVWSKTFYQKPWQRLPDYTPRMLREEFLREIASDTGFSKAAQRLAKENGISRVEAESLLNALQYPKKAGNLEYARSMRLPGDWIETDPLKYLPRYFEQVYGRIAFAEQFGVKGQKMNELLTKAVGGGRKYRKKVDGKMKTFKVKYGGNLDAKFATDLKKIAMGFPPRDKSLEEIAKMVMGAQVLTKMGPLSTILNISQSANTFAREGGINFTKGVLRSFTDEGQRLGAVAYQKGIRDALLNMAGGGTHWAQRYLKWVGFTPAERMNRLLAANAGVVTMERLIGQAIKKGTGLTDDMVRRGLSPEDFDEIARLGGKMTRQMEDKVGFLASEMTQHATHFKDIPLGWQTPAMKVAMQYKSFIYQQSRFLTREVLKPAQEYFLSNGKKGTLGPLVRATAAFGLGGQVVTHLRDQVRQMTGKLTGIEHEPKIPLWEVDDPVVQMIQDSFMVGSLGLAGDLAERAARRDLAGWFLGPTWGDVTDAVEGTVDFTARAQEDQEIPWERLYAQLIRRIPAATVLPSGAPMRTRLRDLVGM
jgi:hypothetical protein